MQIDSLALHQLRSHHRADFHFDPAVTVISGPNGSGKTTLLEAIHILTRGSSFRGPDSELIEFDQAWWRVEGSFDGHVRDVRYSLETEKPSRQIIIDGTKRGRFTSRYALPVVLFEPDDLALIHGSPLRRRRFIDDLIVRLYPQFSRTFHRYERALLQRNNLLKQGGRITDTLFVWDVTLAELAAQIIQKRQLTIERLSPLLTLTYQAIAFAEQRTDEVAEMSYTPALAYSHHTLQQSVISLLSERHQRDIMTGFTSVGPHRDDITFTLRGHSAEATASRGEIRTIILALKLAEASLIADTTGQQPLLLFDDVFSELDSARRHSLLESSLGRNQLIITTTDGEIIPAAVQHVRL